jgi:hypothetical protein
MLRVRCETAAEALTDHNPLRLVGIIVGLVAGTNVVSAIAMLLAL